MFNVRFFKLNFWNFPFCYSNPFFIFVSFLRNLRVLKTILLLLTVNLNEYILNVFFYRDNFFKYLRIGSVLVKSYFLPNSFDLCDFVIIG